MGSSEHHILQPRVSPWKLTPREAEIMDAVCAYGSNKKVGLVLGMTENTVAQHMHELYDKFDCRNRVVTACKWQKWRLAGLLSP